MVGCGRWVTDLRGHCLRDHVPEVFRDLFLTGEGQVVYIADYPEGALGIRGALFGYVGGLFGTIGCLEGHSVELAEVAAMREVCRVEG